MNEIDRSLSNYRKHVDMLTKFVAYYESGDVIRPFGEDPAEVTVKHLEKLKADKAYYDGLIPRLEAIRDIACDPEPAVSVSSQKLT